MKKKVQGAWVARSVERLPSAQVVNLYLSRSCRVFTSQVRKEFVCSGVLEVSFFAFLHMDLFVCLLLRSKIRVQICG